MTPKQFINLFNENYSYINWSNSEATVAKFLAQSFIKDRSDDSKLDLFADFLLSSGECDVQE